MKVGEQAVYFARLKGMDKADAIRALKAWFERLIDGWWTERCRHLQGWPEVQLICTVV